MTTSIFTKISKKKFAVKRMSNYRSPQKTYYYFFSSKFDYRSVLLLYAPGD